jgi:hypothetical protein
MIQTNKILKISVHIAIATLLIVYTILIENKYGLRILDYGPKQTQVGKSFNIQPNGKSALWFKTKGIATKNIRLKWDNLILETKLNSDTGLVSALISEDLIKKEGKHILYLIDEKEYLSSNKVNFDVKNSIQ